MPKYIVLFVIKGKVIKVRSLHLLIAFLVMTVLTFLVLDGSLYRMLLM